MPPASSETDARKALKGSKARGSLPPFCAQEEQVEMLLTTRGLETAAGPPGKHRH